MEVPLRQTPEVSHIGPANGTARAMFHDNGRGQETQLDAWDLPNYPGRDRRAKRSETREGPPCPRRTA